MDFRTRLKQGWICLDGAMGTMLQARGLKMGETPEVLNLEKPELLQEIHQEYIQAGADVVYANTFGANRYRLAHSGYCVSEIIKAGIENA